LSEYIEDWLILANARISGPQAVELIAHFGSIGDVTRSAAGLLLKAGVREKSANAIRQPDRANIDSAMSWLQEPEHHIVSIDSPDYPPLLLQIPGPPALVYVNGNPDALHLPAMAIVGSRNPTSGGWQNAHDFAAHLGRAGFCILSGLAQGIDTEAHEGALDGKATTVAFLGHGIDRIYPAENRDLAYRIVASGALVTEYPLGSPPLRENFPARNRLISGCSMGTLVVEAARRSGSLITARLASEQGREVFAIPGSIHNAMSRGCHQLIRQGAKLVETADDIVSELAPIARHMAEGLTEHTPEHARENASNHLMQNDESAGSSPLLSDDRDDDYKLLIETMGYDPATADDLAEKSGLTIDQVSSMLLILELEGESEALHGGQYSLLGSSSWHERKRTRLADVPV
jgi:DNA processing protein